MSIGKALVTLLLALSSAAFAQQQCSLGPLVGTYLATYNSGYALMPQQNSPLPAALPGVFMGVFSIDHAGNVTGAETDIIMGTALEYETVSGTVELKSDCSGTIRRMVRVKGSNAAPFPFVERFVAIPGGAVKEISTTIIAPPAGGFPGVMGLGTWRQISSIPNVTAW